MFHLETQGMSCLRCHVIAAFNLEPLVLRLQQAPNLIQKRIGVKRSFSEEEGELLEMFSPGRAATSRRGHSWLCVFCTAHNLSSMGAWRFYSAFSACVARTSWQLSSQKGQRNLSAALAWFNMFSLKLLTCKTRWNSTIAKSSTAVTAQNWLKVLVVETKNNHWVPKPSIETMRWI